MKHKVDNKSYCGIETSIGGEPVECEYGSEETDCKECLLFRIILKLEELKEFWEAKKWLKK